MQWILLATVIFILCFSFVVLFGAPYLPTLSRQAEIALDFIDLKPGETLLELGSGDGKILLLAARRGWNVVGIEINPILVFVSRIRTWKYRKRVKIVWGNLWNSEKWPPADGIFIFLLPKLMKKLDTKVEQWHNSKPLKLVSFAFPIPDKKPTKENKLGVYLYKYK
jgi:SAM-dependent methyltransferase